MVYGTAFEQDLGVQLSCGDTRKERMPVAGPVAVDCLACGRRIARPVAGEGKVGGTKSA